MHCSKNFWQFFGWEEIDHLTVRLHSLLYTLQICSTVEQAQKLAYDRSVGCRAVSLSGDDIQPNGRLTGGHRDLGSMLLPVLDKMYGRYARSTVVNQQIGAIESKIGWKKSVKSS